MSAKFYIGFLEPSELNWGWIKRLFIPTKTYSMILWNWCSRFYSKYLILEWKSSLGQDIFSVSAPVYNRCKTLYKKNFLWRCSKAMTWSPPIKQGTLLLCKHELMTSPLPETITYMKPCQNIGMWQSTAYSRVARPRPPLN